MEVVLRIEVDNHPDCFRVRSGLMSDAAAVWVMQNVQQVSLLDCDAQLSAVFQANSSSLSSLSLECWIIHPATILQGCVAA